MKLNRVPLPGNVPFPADVREVQDLDGYQKLTKETGQLSYMPKDYITFHQKRMRFHQRRSSSR
jgi:hypothetical protein